MNNFLIIQNELTLKEFQEFATFYSNVLLCSRLCLRILDTFCSFMFMQLNIHQSFNQWRFSCNDVDKKKVFRISYGFSEENIFFQAIKVQFSLRLLFRYLCLIRYRGNMRGSKNMLEST
ncbi:CLUMA_CG018537, isoform A [Clunio marinus]|uniref:CLUMA_CG018537, isoform A n=1 Tax=Clunio marinus TaxID=568069 RepID=A0A1J1J1G2_9DIPT|nr:CLUMA_CG018537, isoform A [Clunio marinus]